MTLEARDRRPVPAEDAEEPSPARTPAPRDDGWGAAARQRAAPDGRGVSEGRAVSAGRRSASSTAALLHALFDGLSREDRAWVLDRIEHYRRLAAANEISEGRL